MCRIAKSEKFSARRRFQKGGAIVYAMVISFIGVIIVTSLATYFESLTKTVLKNNDIGALSAALHSSVDYTLNGVRNRWCFSSNWSQNPTCSLTNPNNVERLLITDEALRAIEDSMPAASYGGEISNVRIKSIVGSVRWSEITPEHPLYYVIKGLKDIGQDFVFNFRIIRVDNGVQKGREVVIQVESELVLGSRSLIRTTSDRISAVSSVMVFPREVNTNALMIGNNLFLDRPAPSLEATANGNVYISPVANPNTPGIHFDSPVFVNGNVYIPAADAIGYTPVTFADKVILGSGRVLEGKGATASYSKPANAGGIIDRFYSQTDQFGGFLRGVLLDPGADEGLRILTKVAPAPPIVTDAEICILRNSARTDLSLTKNSQLFVKQLPGGSEAAAGATTNVNTTLNFRANLGALNNFYKQGRTGSQQLLNYSPAELAPQVNYSGATEDQRPIMRLAIGLNGMINNVNGYVAADMSSNAVLEIAMNPNDPSAKIRITTTPFSYGTSVQNNAFDIKVELLNQEKFALFPFPVRPVGSTVTTSPEPSIDINIESFDVAYTTASDGTIASSRIKGETPLPSTDCRPGSTEYTSDIYVYNGTHRCYSQFAWHPEMGRYKSNGFSFKRAHGGTERRFAFTKGTAGGAGINGGYFGCPAFDNSCKVYGNVDDFNRDLAEKDWVAFDKSCFSPPAGTDMFPSFQAVDWSNTSFTQQARRSWGFTEPGTATEPGYDPGTLELDEKGARHDGPLKPIFHVAAIYNTCRIKKEANFVAGFFVCDNLIIDPRTEPLRIIGTFIVSKLKIDDSAIQTGIRWSNIYYPSAVYEMRKVGILNTSVAGGTNCDVPSDPLWHPYPSVEQAQFLFKCNPISLRNKADPFKWTMVDPDCGLVGNEVRCKYRIMRYDVVELKRLEFL